MNFFLPRPSRRASRLDERGLTLLEMLITLIILSAMGIIAAEAFRLGRRSWEGQERRAEAEQRIRVVFETLAQEMGSIQPVTEIVDEKRVLAFEGKPDRIRFYGRPDPYQSFPYDGMARSLSVYVDPEKGLVIDERYPQVTEPSARRMVSVVEPKVVQIAFRYLQQSAELIEDFLWVESWNPAEFLEKQRELARKPGMGPQTGQGDRPASGIGFPLAVEVKVILSGQERDEAYTFVFPVHIGREI